MIFAFLPTAVVFFVSMFFFGAAVALLSTGSMFGMTAGMIAMLLSIIAEMAAIKGSHKLYAASMSLLPLDYDRWLDKQQKIANRSYGAKRKLVICNIIYGALTYEHTDTAMEYLELLRPAAEKHTQPVIAYHYYAGLLSVKEKMRDLAASDQLLSRMYEALNHPKFPGGGIKATYASRFEYARLEIEFYKHTPEELRTTHRSIAEQMIAASRMVGVVGGDVDKIIAYSTLTDYYNSGLSYAVWGQQQEADRYFEAIVSSGSRYPMIDRVRRYLETRDLAVLFEIIP